MRKLIASALLALSVALPSFAQNSIVQGGPVAPNHAPMYAPGSGQQPVVMDSGPASGQGVQSGLSELLLVGQGQGVPPFVNSGTGPNAENFCNYDAPVSNLSGYHYLCMSPNAQGGGLISYGAAGGATPLPLQFLVNGTLTSAGLGTVTSVGLASPSNTLTLGGTNPVTTSGTIQADINTGKANTWTATQTFPASSITNSELTNSSTTVNGQNCALGGSCTVGSTATQITVGATAITGGTPGNIEFNNAGVLGEKSVTGTGSVVLATSPTITGPIVNGFFPAGRSISSGSTDTATTADYEVRWNKASGSASAQTIPACNSGNDKYLIVITDEKGDAPINNITITPASGTIAQNTGYIISTPFGSATFHCDGANTNYTVN